MTDPGQIELGIQIANLSVLLGIFYRIGVLDTIVKNVKNRLDKLEGITQ